MTLFLLRRAALLVVSLLAASVLVFLALRLLPGDVAQTIGGIKATPAQVAAVRHDLGLDRPLAAQYGDWIGGVVTGDFGRSVLDGTSVSGQLAEKFAVTGPLAAGAVVLALAFAVPLGVLAAVRRDSRLGSAVNTVGQLGIALPTLWTGLLLVVVFAVQVPWLPAQGFPVDGWAEPGQALRSLVLPWLTLALAEGAVLLRFVRSAVLDVLHQDWLRTARAKGRTRTSALLRHGLRNAAVPVVSVLGLQIAALVAGAVVVEQVFVLPGVGQMLITDVGNRDLDKVQGEILLLTAAVLVVGFLVDLAHRLIDPRLRSTL
ncbi:ABC transporter permease [Streptomyces antibioticus]|uniref:ABC transporter permease n=1 Tax=Streptomyces antibioticus TaxID=1890 RepID=A0AAE6Y2Q1_STRAT|nr:ABC transporter permease [Streptomyces antibioticus]OOQ54679.1 ABC transporter permease [Streptomyces antibioticus]QIT42315.1 ABC transporter permease [Streptomyces antibioticus]